MLNLGIIGLGTMGMTHLAAYEKLAARGLEARILAVADKKFATGSAAPANAGNIAGQAAAGDAIPAGITRFDDPAALLADPRIDAVDICAPTPAHRPLALAAIAAGKHVLVEKPAARTAREARELAAAARAAGVVLMPAHCMRFWPGWDWLKDAVATGRHGAVQSAVFTRVGAQPPSPFYHDGAAAGGAHLDLHIHDADFVLHLFGKPSNVAAQGWRGASGAIEHTLARYRFDALPGALVAAEGAWTRDAEKRPFVMRYAVRFERASATYEFGEPPALTLYEAGKPPAPVPLDAALGYEREVAEFVRCAAAGTESAIVPATAGADALALVESELLSIELGFPVPHE